MQTYGQVIHATLPRLEVTTTENHVVHFTIRSKDRALLAHLTLEETVQLLKQLSTWIIETLEHDREWEPLSLEEQEAIERCEATE